MFYDIRVVATELLCACSEPTFIANEFTTNKRERLLITQKKILYSEEGNLSLNHNILYKGILNLRKGFPKCFY